MREGGREEGTVREGGGDCEGGRREKSVKGRAKIVPSEDIPISY